LLEEEGGGRDADVQGWLRPRAGKAPSVCREGSLRVQGGSLLLERERDGGAQRRLPPFAGKAPSLCREGHSLLLAQSIYVNSY